MARVLFINGGLEGHVNPTLGLVEELIRRGEEVLYVTTEPFRNRLEALGAVVRTFDGAKFSECMRAGEISNFLGVATGLLRTADLIIPRVLEQIAGEHVDYVIHDSMLGCGRLIAQILKRPAVTSCTTFAQTEATVDRMLEDLSRSLPDGTYPRALDTFWETARKIEETYGVVIGSVYEAYCNPEPLILVYTSKYFQPDGDHYDASFKFVGPAMRSAAVQESFDVSSLDRDPVIYIAFGTIFNQAVDFYRLCFSAFADAPYTVVLSVGRQTQIEGLGDIPTNFIVRDHLPQLTVLERARLFITHGGMNSASEGLYYGVPLMVFPQGADQHRVARRVAELGAGVRGEQKGWTATDLRTEAERLIGNTSVSEVCGRVGDSFRAAGGFPRAVDEVFRGIEPAGA